MIFHDADQCPEKVKREIYEEPCIPLDRSTAACLVVDLWLYYLILYDQIVRDLPV